ncbi:unnamed protein product [Schistocephalus solidus]|uniref:Uncharacterized protein n=1 Tax=Schistocephalus solidus TaxID=70667 RepID=A0A3P7DSK9_SCHSO|nr:unnamed protein product [Schistocephalus solidus]
MDVDLIRARVSRVVFYLQVTEADVVVPLIMGLCLGILHSQITSAHGSHGSISTAGPSAVTVGAADVALASVNGANTVTAAGASAQGNTSGTAEAFLCDQSCLSNCYAGRVSDSIEAFNAQASSSSSKLKKWRCRVSEKSGHKCSVHIKDKPKASATSSSSSSHPLVESENLCDADERANEADEDSCAEENKHYQSNRPSDGDLQLSQAQQQQQQVQTSSKSRSHFLHSRNRKQELSGDALLREAPPDESAVFSRQITQLPSAGHDADVESDFYDLEAKRGDDAEKTGTSENGSFTGVINATDGDAPDPWPIRIKKKRNHVFGTPLVTGSCLRKRSNSLSPGFCFSKFTATTERLSKTVLSLNGRPKEFSVPPPPEDVLQHFKEAKFRGVPDPEVFAEYFEQPNRSPKKLPDLDRQKGLITKPSAGTKLGKKTIDAFKISEGSKRSSEKLQPSSHKKAEFKSERSVRQHAVLPAATKTFIKLGSGSCSIRRNNAALKAFKIAQLNEKRVRREVKLESAILDAESKTELARVEAEAESDVDLGEDVDTVKSLERIARLAQYFKECTFEVYLESKVEDPRQRLLYLTHFCRADARVAMEECVVFPSSVAYKRAREIIEDLFGQSHIVARSLLERLFSQARQTTHTAKSLSDLYIKMKCCEIAPMLMNYVSDLHSLSVLEDPNFTDLTEFVKTRSRIARSRFGQLAREEEARDRQNHSNNTVQRQRGEDHATFLAFSGAASGRQPRFICSQIHEVASYPRLLSMSVADRWNCIRENKACFVCLDKTHFANV